mgnify:CR=1 FL=1
MSTVVLFDELDELVVDRNPSKDSNIDKNPVFITASMLTRLAELHDARTCLFCFSTNYYYRMDRAVRGVGRFDRIIMFDRPDFSGRATHVASLLGVLEHGHALTGTSTHWAGSLMAKNSGADNLIAAIKSIADLTIGGSFVEIGAFVSSIRNDAWKMVEEAKSQKDVQNYLYSTEVQDRCWKKLRSRSDYCNWCVEDGIRELNSVEGEEFNEEAKEKLVRRWSRICRALGCEQGEGQTDGDKWLVERLESLKNGEDPGHLRVQLSRGDFEPDDLEDRAGELES